MHIENVVGDGILGVISRLKTQSVRSKVTRLPVVDPRSTEISGGWVVVR